MVLHRNAHAEPGSQALEERCRFELAYPSTLRLDVGLSLEGVPTSSRLESAAGFNAMCTHRVRVESPSQIDDELPGWIRQAYEPAG